MNSSPNILLALPPDVEGSFVAGGATLGEVLTLATRLEAATKGERDAGYPVCLVAEDKATVAAAVIAAARDGAELIVPHSLSTQVLAEVVVATGVRLAITDRDRDLPSGLAPVIVGAEDVSSTKPMPISLGESPCIHLFTGGSTGTPKMWSKSSLNLFAEALFLAQEYRLGPEDTIVATVPTQHIYGLLFSVLVPLVAGAATVNQVAFFPADVAELTLAHRATVLVASPVHYKAMAALLPDCGSFRLAFSSGGMLEEEAAIRFHQRTGSAVVEVYGSTETGGIAVRCRAHGDVAWTPLAAVDCVVDADKLLVSSPFVSIGVPLSERGFFTAGDRVESAGDREFHLLGRADGVVKVGGKRVVLEDVQEKIARIPGVGSAFVFSVPAAGGRENNIAALVETELSVAQLRAGIVPLLVPAAVPRLLRIVEHIPVKPTGKVDRTAAAELLGLNYSEQTGSDHD